MNANRKKQVGLLLIVIVLAGLLAVLAGGVAAQDEVTGPPNPPVIPPHADAFGKTYGEWGAEWWKWALALTADETHPLIADGDVDCSMGQDGKVWFLGGTYDAGPDPENPSVILGKADRTCEVLTGKALFFPIVNIICSEIGGDGSTEEELIAWCADPVVNFFVYPLSVKIDGIEFTSQELEEYKTVSDQLFYVDPLPYPNLLDNPPDHPAPRYSEGVAAHSGYYLLLPPLPEGEHDIDFDGEILVPDFDGDGEPDYHFVLDISYDLTVVDE